MSILYILLLLCISTPALAQQITIETMCEKIAVDGPDYTPGVDVHGNPIASADIGEPLEAVIHPLVVPIEVDALKFIGVDAPKSLNDAGELKTDVAFISLFEDGHIEYNGRDISDSAEYICVENVESAADSVENKPEETVKRDSAAPSEPVKSSAEVNAELETLIDKVTTNEQEE